MRLRYYLRGLGTGILVAALILGRLISESRPLTDAEIKAKALTLGMVDANSLSLSNVGGNGGVPQGSLNAGSDTDSSGSEGPLGSDGSTASDPDASVAPGVTDDLDPDASVAPGVTDDLDPDASVASGDTDNPDPAINSGSSSVSTANPETTAPAPDSVESVTIEIFSGEGSYTVSMRLEEAGLVADAREFDTYLVDNGYSRSIRAGTYRIPVGASWDEIIDIIS